MGGGGGGGGRTNNPTDLWLHWDWRKSGDTAIVMRRSPSLSRTPHGMHTHRAARKRHNKINKKKQTGGKDGV